MTTTEGSEPEYIALKAGDVRLPCDECRYIGHKVWMPTDPRLGVITKTDTSYLDYRRPMRIAEGEKEAK
jgi:hypothetical protein